MNKKTPRFSWGHINLNVRNLDRSIAFYEKLGFEEYKPGIPYLGLSAAPEPTAMPDESACALGLAPGTRGRACIMQLGDGYPKLDLTEFAIPESETKQEAPLSNRDIGLVRLCLGTRDLKREFDVLSKQGVIFLSAPQSAKDGMAEIATCIDPDGALIELIQVHRDKWPAPPAR